MKRYGVSTADMGSAQKPFAVRAIALSLLVMCAAILMISTSDNPRVAPLKHTLMDVAAPVVSVFSEPAQAIAGTKQWWNNVTQVYSENTHLREANDALKHWQSVAVSLEAENKELRALAGYRPVESTAYITARVVGYSETVAGHSALINVGFDDGVRSHQAVIGADGLIGRIADVGKSSARILLLSDMNARVPVVGLDSREKAMLVGTGSAMPKLQFVPQDSQLKVGEMLVTTEDGGVIPAGIAVGQVFSRSGAQMKVRVNADARRATYVRVVSHDTPLEAAPTLVQ